MRPINFGRVPPSQPVANDVDYPADHATIIDTWYAVGSWEVEFNALKLGFAGPVMIRQGQVLLPSLNHNSNDNGIPGRRMTEMQT